MYYFPLFTIQKVQILGQAFWYTSPLIFQSILPPFYHISFPFYQRLRHYSLPPFVISKKNGTFPFLVHKISHNALKYQSKNKEDQK